MCRTRQVNFTAFEFIYLIRDSCKFFIHKTWGKTGCLSNSLDTTRHPFMLIWRNAGTLQSTTNLSWCGKVKRLKMAVEWRIGKIEFNPQKSKTMHRIETKGYYLYKQYVADRTHVQSLNAVLYPVVYNFWMSKTSISSIHQKTTWLVFSRAICCMRYFMTAGRAN